MNEWTPEELRECANGERRFFWRRAPDQLRAHADLIERYAKLKEHAEATISKCELVRDSTYRDAVTLRAMVALIIDAYRDDFPKEEK